MISWEPTRVNKGMPGSTINGKRCVKFTAMFVEHIIPRQEGHKSNVRSSSDAKLAHSWCSSSFQSCTAWLRSGLSAGQAKFFSNEPFLHLDFAGREQLSQNRKGPYQSVSAQLEANYFLSQRFGTWRLGPHKALP